MPRQLPKIYITMGDVNGIGPEVTLKSLGKIVGKLAAQFTIVGSLEVLDFYKRLLNFEPIVEPENQAPHYSRVQFIPVDLSSERSFQPGQVSSAVGKASIDFIEQALQRIGRNPQSALVTGPVSKIAIWQAGIRAPGQTEFLGKWYGAKEAVMMLIANELRVGLATTHFPIREIPTLLSRDLIVDKCTTIFEDLKRRFQIDSPRIAVAALNPHGGEGGFLGDEEREIIVPAVGMLGDRKIIVEGPLSSDTLFTHKQIERFDCVLAMYHDQGMIPIKMSAFGKAVNYTAGLPIVRTSPDHGTAFDIAGKGVADSSSMIEAIKLAIELVG